MKKGIYGSSAAKTLTALDQVFKILDPIEISTPVQTMELSGHALKQTETYRSKYETLLPQTQTPIM